MGRSALHVDRSLARAHASAAVSSVSRTSWPIHVVRGLPAGRFQSCCGMSPDLESTASFGALCAGVLAGKRRIWPKKEWRRAAILLCLKKVKGKNTGLAIAPNTTDKSKPMGRPRRGGWFSQAWWQLTKKEPWATTTTTTTTTTTEEGKRRSGSSFHQMQCKSIRSLRSGEPFAVSRSPGDLIWLEDLLTSKWPNSFTAPVPPLCKNARKYAILALI